jgi:hypothetical protein
MDRSFTGNRAPTRPIRTRAVSTFGAWARHKPPARTSSARRCTNGSQAKVYSDAPRPPLGPIFRRIRVASRPCTRFPEVSAVTPCPRRRKPARDIAPPSPPRCCGAGRARRRGARRDRRDAEPARAGFDAVRGNDSPHTRWCPLALACGVNGFRRSVHRCQAIGRSVGPGAPQRHLLRHGLGLDPAAPRATRSRGAVGHHPAAGWVTRAPLKFGTIRARVDRPAQPGPTLGVEHGDQLASPYRTRSAQVWDADLVPRIHS